MGAESDHIANLTLDVSVGRMGRYHEGYLTLIGK